MWWRALLAVLAGLLLVYLVLLAVLWRYSRTHPEAVSMREALRLLPDVLRLLRRLAADRALPRGVRVRLVLLLVYLAARSTWYRTSSRCWATPTTPSPSPSCCARVARRAGPDALARHWPGTPDGLRLVQQLAGSPPSREQAPDSRACGGAGATGFRSDGADSVFVAPPPDIAAAIGQRVAR